MTELQEAILDKRIIECFATGSKSGIIPVSTIGYAQYAVHQEDVDKRMKSKDDSKTSLLTKYLETMMPIDKLAIKDFSCE